MAKTLDIRKLISLPSFYFPKVSYGRDKVAFYGDSTGRIELYVLDIASGQTRQISHGELPKSIRYQPIWSRNDRYILFTKDHDGDEQHDIYSFDVETGELSMVTESDGQNYPLEVSPDGEELLFLSTRDGNQLNLWCLSREKQVRQVTSFANPVLNAVWSPDGEWIYFVSNESPDLRNQDVYRIRRDGSGLDKFWGTKDGSEDYISQFSPDGKFLGVTSDFSGTKRSGVLDIETKSVWWLGEGEHEESFPRFSPNGEFVLTTVNIDATWSPRIYRLSGSEEVPLLNIPGGLASSVQFVSDTKIFLVHSDPTHRPRMLIYDIANDSYSVLMDAEYGSIKREDLTDAEYVSYRSFDGSVIYGILWKPKDASAEKPVPAVISIHGGPGAQDLRCFNLEAQVLTSLGFAVFQPNYRSSAGYGKAFLEANLMDWGGGDLKDIIEAAKYLRTLSWVAKDRIAVEGGSYGGYLTYMAMTRAPEEWKAGIAYIGITDLHKLYESSMPHFKYFLKYFMGDPEKNYDLWRDRSPVTHAANVRAPLFIIHGVNDPRCPIEQARLFRDKLAESGFVEGKDFKYVELGEEGHGSTDIEQKIRIFELKTEFLLRTVKC